MVILIMLVFYRMSGVLAVVALALYILFTLGGLSMIDATLTLPGLAGIVLSVGIAVDANVLIFERIREELLHGKTVRLAVDEGFKHAMNAIIDSNVSTVLTALFLFQFGTGTGEGVRGHPDHGHHRLDDHGGLRHPHVLHDLAAAPADHDHPEHLTC